MVSTVKFWREVKKQKDRGQGRQMGQLIGYQSPWREPCQLSEVGSQIVGGEETRGREWRKLLLGA